MYVTIGTLEAVEFAPLMPAPSVREIEALPVATSDAGLHDGPLIITGTYRGHLLYLENGASVYRDSSKSISGNGCLGLPTESEECIVTWRGKAYRANVEFNINVGPKAPQA